MESNGSIEIPLPRWTEPGSLESAKQNIYHLGRSMHEHAFLLGKYLLWVKAEVGHGAPMPAAQDRGGVKAHGR